MRVSADRNDPGYREEMNFDVRLNGVTLRRGTVVTADEDKGEVLVICFGKDGRPVPDHARRDVLTDLRRGKVEIVPFVPDATAPRYDQQDFLL